MTWLQMQVQKTTGIDLQRTLNKIRKAEDRSKLILLFAEHTAYLLTCIKQFAELEDMIFDNCVKAFLKGKGNVECHEVMINRIFKSSIAAHENENGQEKKYKEITNAYGISRNNRVRAIYDFVEQSYKDGSWEAIDVDITNSAEIIENEEVYCAECGKLNIQVIMREAEWERGDNDDYNVEGCEHVLGQVIEWSGTGQTMEQLIEDAHMGLPSSKNGYQIYNMLKELVTKAEHTEYEKLFENFKSVRFIDLSVGDGDYCVNVHVLYKTNSFSLKQLKKDVYNALKEEGIFE